MNDGFGSGIACGLVFALMLLVGPVSCTIDNYYEGLAIKNGCASYNTETGDFEWNEEKK